MKGYQFIGRVEVFYSSKGNVTFTAVAFDGTSPLPLVLPSTGGATQRAIFNVTANKGQLYSYSAVGAQPFQFFDTLVHVKAWGSEGPFKPVKLIGGTFGDAATI
jgi:hypothetical protein